MIARRLCTHYAHMLRLLAATAALSASVGNSDYACCCLAHSSLSPHSPLVELHREVRLVKQLLSPLLLDLMLRFASSVITAELVIW